MELKVELSSRPVSSTSNASSSIIPPETTPRDPLPALLLGRAGLSPPQRIPRLSQLPAPDARPSLPPEHQSAARALLVAARVGRPGYRPPESRTFHFLRSRSRRDLACNEDNWTFSAHEVATAFDGMLSGEMLPLEGVADALLRHVAVVSMEELWTHLHRPKLEKKAKGRFSKMHWSTAVTPRIAWLDVVTTRNSVEYIRVVCRAGIGQEALDRALSVALSQPKPSLESIGALLAFGASASPCQAEIRARLQLGNVPLARLLLSAPQAMSVEAWQYCIEPQVVEVPEDAVEFQTILLLCLAHRPDVVSEKLLLQALASQNTPAVATLLAYAPSPDAFSAIHEAACVSACAVQDHDRRHTLLALLAAANLLSDGPTLREELVNSVKARHFSTTQLLVAAGVVLDAEPHNALFWAVMHMDLDALELLRTGVMVAAFSPALRFVPEGTDEQDMLRLLNMFADKGLAGEHLDLQLVRAARRKELLLVVALCEHGASIEFNQAAAVKEALSHDDFLILEVLLRRPCSRDVLSAALLPAMAIGEIPKRLEAMQALVEKGVLVEQLGLALQALVLEDTSDMDLMQLLLRHEAPIDGVGSDADNAVLIATGRGNMPVLHMLCSAKPGVDTLSKSVHVAFGTRNAHGYDLALDMVELLLQTGASGIHIHQTLLTAAQRDAEMRIVRALLEHGADANYGTGASYIVAFRASNLPLLKMLCASCPPSQASIEAGLLSATNPHFFNAEALEVFLRSSTHSAAALDTSWSAEKLKDNPHAATIVSSFLGHGLNVDMADGAVPCFAIQQGNLAMLRDVLAANPTIDSLRAAFVAAKRSPPGTFRLGAMGMLLEEAKAAQIGQSEALPEEMLPALAGDVSGLVLLLRYRADVNVGWGVAVKMAAEAASLAVLDLLLQAQPDVPMLRRACLATAEAPYLSHEQKGQVLERLLSANRGAMAQDMSQLLHECVVGLPEHTQLPEMLLGRGAFVRAETLEAATATADPELFLVLTEGINNASTLTDVFMLARTTSMASDRRYMLFLCLLDRGIPRDSISSALLDSLRDPDLDDLTLPTLLLEHGADPGHDNGTAFALALGRNSLNAVRLLSQFLVDARTADSAFNVARRSPLSSAQLRLDVYRSLLQWHIDKQSVDDALSDNLASDQCHVEIVRLLLVKGADPNHGEGRCFVRAAERRHEDAFRALCRGADTQVVFEAFLGHFSAEQEARFQYWFNVCLEEQTRPYRVTENSENDLLFRYMRKFPKGSHVLEILLSIGLSASIRTTHSLSVGWAPEPCTALIWALVAEPKVDNASILALLSQEDEANPTYCTPTSGVSAAFCCLLDKTRTPILQALLELAGDEILSHTISVPSFKTLTASATDDDDESGLLDDEDSLPLVHAALFLGNCDAFHLLGGGAQADDGTLHNAALFALPRFVEMLLPTHDPDCRLEEFDHMIPLALACSAKPQPWCVVANQEATWEARQEETMKLLAARTSPAWRYNHQTVLHVALGAGLAATRAMVKALNVKGDAQRDDRYLYRDKEGIELSPDQYVTRVLLDVGEEDKAALMACLTKAGMTSRLFKRIRPGEGEQPTGYCGLPADLAEQWDPTTVRSREMVPARDSERIRELARHIFASRDSMYLDAIDLHDGHEGYYDDDGYDMAEWTDTD